MGTTHRRTTPRLIDDLLRHPERYEFFQAVRILRAHRRETHEPRTGADARDSDASEAVRFRALPTLGFPARPVHAIVPPAAQHPAEMSVSFFGLIGPSGPLPQHYTEAVIERLSLRDETLRDFIDVFHHRALWLFWLAWAKYRLPIGYETRTDSEEDPVTRSLFALVGLGTPGLRNRGAFDDFTSLAFGGSFSNRIRTAAGLEALLGEALGFDARVEELVGRWLELDPADHTRLSAQRPCNNRLGVDASLGGRVWDVQSKIRVHVGPLTREQYGSVLEGTEGQRALNDLIRAYVGVELDFDVSVTIATEEAPPTRVGETAGSALGRTSWLRSSRSHPLPRAGSVLVRGV